VLSQESWRKSIAAAIAFPRVTRAGMRVDGLIFASDKMIETIRQDQAPDQVANVATLRGSRRPASRCQTSTGAMASASAAFAPLTGRGWRYISRRCGLRHKLRRSARQNEPLFGRCKTPYPRIGQGSLLFNTFGGGASRPLQVR